MMCELNNHFAGVPVFELLCYGQVVVCCSYLILGLFCFLIAKDHVNSADALLQDTRDE
jgi:hypothetical protein